MRTPPTYVSQALKRLDPLLRIRWSREKKKFSVERKIIHHWALTPPVIWEKDGYGRIMEVKLPEYSERYIFWRDKYIPILYVQNPNSRLIHYLRIQDAFRFRRRKEAVKSLTEFENKEESRTNKKVQGEFEDVSGEAYDDMMWKSGLRVAMRA